MNHRIKDEISGLFSYYLTRAFGGYCIDEIIRYFLIFTTSATLQSTFRIPHFTFDIRQSSFIAGFQPEKSYSSGVALKTDGHRFSFDNDRHFARSFGVFQHGFKMPGFFYHIIIIDLTAVFGKCCTSCPGIRSGILPENQDFIRHFSFLPVW